MLAQELAVAIIAERITVELQNDTKIISLTTNIINLI